MFWTQEIYQEEYRKDEPKKASSFLEKNYHPEIDESEILGPEDQRSISQ